MLRGSGERLSRSRSLLLLWNDLRYRSGRRVRKGAADACGSWNQKEGKPCGDASEEVARKTHAGP